MATVNAAALSSELADLVERIAPSVVRVEARRRGPSSGVAWSADVVVTASHTVEREEELRVGLGDGRTTAATLLGRDSSTDLAALRVENAGLAAPAWRRDAPRTGELVLALSRPGRGARASLGVVHARGDEWRPPTGGRIEAYLESSVPIRRGFSGGLLVDASGSGVGVNTSGLLRGTSVAVPPATVERIVGTLLAGGRIRRGYLGIGTWAVRLPGDLAQKTGQRSGLLVVSVAPDSPASAGGMLYGDTLVSVGGTTVAHPADLLELLDEQSVGRPVAVEVIRAGEVREITVVPAPRGD